MSHGPDGLWQRRTTAVFGLAFAHAKIVGFRGLSEVAPAVLNGTPLLPQSGQREFAAEVSWNLPSLAPGATSLLDVTVSGAHLG